MEIAEFDRFADEYQEMLRGAIKITGEGPEYFGEYKIEVLTRLAASRKILPQCILDFGSGIGNSVPYFRRHFPAARLTSADVSQRSLDLSEQRFPGMAEGVRIQDNRIPCENDSFDVSFSACVFHHIPHEEHVGWLRELRRVTRPGGMLAIFEHNPLNLLTVRAVDNCPFDENAHLIGAKELVAHFREAGWETPTSQYHLFFPHALSRLRFLEPRFSWIPLGGQYSVAATKPIQV
jgi:SAM-dependent methyltransferase